MVGDEVQKVGKACLALLLLHLTCFFLFSVSLLLFVPFRAHLLSHAQLFRQLLSLGFCHMADIGLELFVLTAEFYIMHAGRAGAYYQSRMRLVDEGVSKLRILGEKFV